MQLSKLKKGMIFPFTLQLNMWVSVVTFPKSKRYRERSIPSLKPAVLWDTLSMQQALTGERGHKHLCCF